MRHIYKPFLLLSLLVISINVSWQVSSYFDFFYQTAYRTIQIDQHVNQYAIENKNLERRSFAETAESVHFRIFSEIVSSINNKGQGLEKIHFYSKKYNKNIIFLSPAEVTHLQDVANLVQVFNVLTLFLLIISLSIMALMKWQRLAFYSYKEGAIAISIFAMTLGLSVAIIGPYTIFRVLHELIFAENQWFFYYQDSLMTTLMKAPDLFAFIALAILLLSMVPFFILLLTVPKLFASSSSTELGLD